MPFTTIDLHAGATTPEQRRRISDAIHRAMIDTLGIPEDDRIHVFQEHPEGNFFHDDVMFGRPRSPRILFVTLSFNERPASVKAELFSAIVARLGEIAGWDPDEVVFRVLETAAANWWASGREVDPVTGYDVRMS